MKIKYPLATFVGIISVILLVYYWPWLSRAADFYVGDNNIYFEPLCRYIGNMLAQGHFPLWNPYLGCGQSIVANPNPSVFYPVHWLFALFPYSQCMAMQMLIHQLVAGVGGWLLAKRLGWGRPAAFVAGAVLAFNGYMFSMIDNFTLASTAAWAPLALWAVLGARDDAQGNRRAISCVVTALATAMMILAARPEIWVPFLVILAAAALKPLLAMNHSFRERFGKTVPAALSLACGVLLAMPEIVPAAEWAARSPRLLTEMRDPLKWSSSWYDFISMFSAFPLGNPFWVSNPYALLIEPAPKQVPFVVSSFIGTLVLTLAAIGALDKNMKHRWLLLGLLVFTIILTAGQNTPVMPHLYRVIPQLSLFRFPVKLMYFAILLLSLLAAHGADRYASHKTDDKSLPFHLRILAMLWAGVLAISVIIYVTAPMDLIGLNPWFSAYVGGAGIDAEKTIALSFSLWSSIALILLVMDKRLYKDAAVNGLAQIRVGTVAVILTLVVPPFVFARPMTKANFYERPSFGADVIQREQDRIHLKTMGRSNVEIAGEVPPPRSVVLTPTESLGIPAAFHRPGTEWAMDSLELYSRQLLEGNTNLDYFIGSLFPYEGANTKEGRELELAMTGGGTKSLAALPAPILAAVCRATRTKYVLEQMVVNNENIPPMDNTLLRRVNEKLALNARIYSVMNSTWPVYFVDNWTVVPNAKAAIDRMTSLKPAAFKAHKEVLLSAAEPGSAVPPPQQKPTGASGKAPVKETAKPAARRTGEPAAKNNSDSVAEAEDLAKQQKSKAKDQTANAAEQTSKAAEQTSKATEQTPNAIEPTSNATEQAANAEEQTEDEVKGSAALRIDRWTPEDIEITAKATAEGCLVVADQIYPGWTVQVDGAPAPLYRANALFKGVLLKPGEHKVRFVFQSNSMNIGLTLAGIGLIGLIATALAGRRRKIDK